MKSSITEHFCQWFSGKTFSEMKSAWKSKGGRLNIVGKRVKEARRTLRPKLTQDQLSGKLASEGVSLDRAAIAKIETGIRRVSDFELRAIAKVLGLDVRWLLGIKSGVQPETISK